MHTPGISEHIWLHENDGNLDNDTMSKTTQTTANKGVECWLSGSYGNHGNNKNHENPGRKPRVSPKSGLEKPSFLVTFVTLLPLFSSFFWESDFYTPPVLGGAALLPFSAQRCIKIRVLRAQDFYTPLALKSAKGQHFPALEVYKNQSPIFAKLRCAPVLGHPFTL